MLIVWVCLMKLCLCVVLMVSRFSVVKLLSIVLMCGCMGGWFSIVRFR